MRTLFLIFIIAGCASSKKTVLKWDKALLNVQGEGVKMTTSQKAKLFNELRADTTFKHLSDFELERHLNEYLREHPGGSTGTAVYLQDKGKKYLITAAHVIIDRIATLDQREQEEMFKQYITARRPPVPFTFIKYLRRFGEPELLKPGFRAYVLSIDEGEARRNAYSLSEELDLAVISLNMTSATELFAETLDKLGYVPITLKDLDVNDQYRIGDDIMCVGFPAPSEITGPSEKYQMMGIIEGKGRSLPIYSFGKIASNHDSLDTFLGDVSIYPGNSGGPVIRKNKMIGIVSKQSTIPVESAEGPTAYSARIPFGYFVKINRIKQLLAEMQSREIPENMTK